MNPPDYTKIVEDCDSALKLDRRYVKALNRRGSALESLERYEEALAGTCILPFIILPFTNEYSFQQTLLRLLSWTSSKPATCRIMLNVY